MALPVTLALLSATATAAPPTFLGAPEDVRIATRAWRAAEACTGRPGAATATVEIVRRSVPLDYLGVARTDPAGRLYRIEVHDDGRRQGEVVVHEVSHAWVSEGPPALVEGTAELLADCIVSQVPGLAPLQFDDGRDLDGLPDLLRWSKPGEDRPAELPANRTDAYVGAARLVRTLAGILPPDALWGAREVGWDTLEAHLAELGATGARVREVLHGGAVAQRAALADLDRDGLTALTEQLGGTDDARFDSDGDGWWDGALGHPAGAVPVPLDGTPVCGSGSGFGGNLRGADLPPLERLGPAGVTLVRFADLPPAESTGGAWVLAPEEGPGCRSSDTATVWAADPALAPLVAPLLAALDDARVAADLRFGNGPQRVAVALGGTRTTVEREVVWLALRDVRQAPPEELARLAVAARRLWSQGVREWPAVEALALALAERDGDGASAGE